MASPFTSYNITAITSSDSTAAIRARYDEFMSQLENEYNLSFADGLDAECDFLYDEALTLTAIYFHMDVDIIEDMLFNS